MGGETWGRGERDKGKEEGAGNDEAAPLAGPRGDFSMPEAGGGPRRWIAAYYLFSLSFFLGSGNIIASFVISWEMLIWFSQHTYWTSLWDTGYVTQK